MNLPSWLVIGYMLHYTNVKALVKVERVKKGHEGIRRDPIRVS